MKRLLKKFQSVLRKRDPPLAPRFNPPASAKQLSKAERALAVKLPQDLRHFLLAANGQTVDCHSDGDVVVPRLRFDKGKDMLTAEGWFADIDSIVESTLFEREYMRAEIPKTQRWGPVKSQQGLIIITAAETPWYFAVDTTPARGGRIGQVVSISFYDEQNLVVARSLSAFIERLIDGFEKDLYHVHENGYLCEV